MGDFYSSGKRESKPRSASSSSESKSPLDKRSRETIDPKTQDEQIEVFVEEPRGVDEGFVALEMALDVTTKLDEILAKLGKLDAIEATLNELRQKMSSVEREVVYKRATRARERKELMKWIQVCSGLTPKLRASKTRLKN